MSVVHFTLCLAYSGYQIITMIQVISGRIENPLQHEEGRWAEHLNIYTDREI